jgi:beta-hydroxylase
VKSVGRNEPYVPVDGGQPEAKLLRDNFDVIKGELDEILKDVEKIPLFHEVDKLQRFISAKDNIAWRTFILKAFNKWLPHNAEQMPKTTALIEKIPKLATALFSIIDGGKHIPPHVGFFKSVLRYHLAFVVPEDAPVYIIVNGEEYHWKEGEDVVFDDTFVHEVWNKSSQRRVVLFCDVLRDRTLPRIMHGPNRLMFRILGSSRKLRAAAKRAEVARDIE